MRERDAHPFVVALHEAGHAVIAAACGLPLRHAIARGSRGEVLLDAEKAALLAARHKRRNHGRAPDKAACIAAELAWMGWAMGGEAAVELRLAARRNAPWQAHADPLRGMSRGDRRQWRAAYARLLDLGVNAGELPPVIGEWTDATLTRHAPTVARVAAALLRHGRLTGVELDRLLAPAAADPGPLLLLLAMGERIGADTAQAWPPAPAA